MIGIMNDSIIILMMSINENKLYAEQTRQIADSCLGQLAVISACMHQYIYCTVY